MYDPNAESCEGNMSFLLQTNTESQSASSNGISKVLCPLINVHCHDKNYCYCCKKLLNMKCVFFLSFFKVKRLLEAAIHREFSNVYG